jgi:hypothetical protein
MTTTTEPVRREPARRDDTIRMQRWLRTPAIPMAKAWWQRQTHQMRTGLVVAAVFALAGTLSLGVSLSRPAGQPDAARAANATALTQEPAPPAAGRVWLATKTWQGSGTKETEPFTVNGHWRVDWIYSPASSAGGVFQVYIYAADGRLLLNVAANNQNGGSDTTFWAGPGTYFLKVNSSSGDWKVGVQDLR